jgi:hypothetical protein
MNINSKQEYEYKLSGYIGFDSWHRFPKGMIPTVVDYFGRFIQLLRPLVAYYLLMIFISEIYFRYYDWRYGVYYEE